MKRAILMMTAILVAAVAIACNSQAPNDAAKRISQPEPARAATQPLPATPDPHGHDAAASRVPAFQIDAASLKSLGPTLPSEKFTGKTREAYKAVKAIPRTIAQLPCYCHCDEGFGHKSLYSCFEDDHAAHCAVCVDEALLAYRLEKNEKLKPEQIRERIIAQYSTEQ
ncbi:MAG: hypothetical protein H7Z16_13920 [Pyrinomonadaceae bacterium]|nr:hypothetical protein [Pyrinomonadaceae bacterium]